MNGGAVNPRRVAYKWPESGVLNGIIDNRPIVYAALAAAIITVAISMRPLSAGARAAP